MASITNSDISVESTRVHKISPDHLTVRSVAAATRQQTADGVSILQYQPELDSIIGSNPRHSLLLSSVETSNNPFFHEACVFLPDHDELYVTSNLLQASSSSQLPVILISKIALRRNASGDITAVEWMKLRPPPAMTMPASGTKYKHGVVYCSRGNLSAGTGGLYYMPHNKPPEALVRSYYGRDFNSVHDVVVSRDGALWFTDPYHGFEQELRRKPQLPCQVFRFVPATGELRVMADGISRPTGLAFSPEEKTLYVTDTAAIRADGEVDFTRPATIYAFDVIERSSSPFLANKRVFAHAVDGVPIAIKCDYMGNVYAGCADGVEVFSAGGKLLGVIQVPGGVTNFCFGKEGEMFLCAEQRLWRIRLSVMVQPLLAGF